MAIVDVADINDNKRNFKSLIKITKELKMAQRPMLNIINLWKDSLYSLFSYHLIDKMRKISSYSEESKFDFEMNPIFNQKFKI